MAAPTSAGSDDDHIKVAGLGFSLQGDAARQLRHPRTAAGTGAQPGQCRLRGRQ